MPYLAILIEHDGYRAGVVGAILAIGTFVSVLTQPIWGILVDRYHMTRITLAMSTLIPGLVAVFFNIHILLLIVGAIALYNVFLAPQAPISDAYAVTNAQRAGASYGSIRLFGSIGFAVGGFASSLYLARFPLTSLWIPYLSIGLLGSTIAFLFPTDGIRFAGAVSIRQGAKALFANRSFVLFLIGGFLVSQTLTAYNSYFSLAFESIGGSISLVGVAVFIASITNVPAMIFARRITDRFGLVPTMLFASIFYIARWLLQAVFPFPWLAIAIQVLHGTSFGFFYVSAVAFVSKTADGKTQATAQSIFGIFCTGIAGIVGNLLNGYLLRYGGPSLMYYVCTFSAVLGALCFWIVGRWQRQGGALGERG